jgi:hypothetical protein
MYGGTGASDWWNETVRNVGRGVSDFANRLSGAIAQSQVPGLQARAVTPSPANMPKTSPLSPSSAAERARSAARARTAPQRTAVQTQRIAGQQQQAAAPTGGGAGGGASSVSNLFSPLFQALEQQRKNAESRYGENVGQIQNIYGQLIGARKDDITDIEEAYKRLQTAAASRGAATLGAMQGREATRFSQNEAILDSMGVGGIGTTAGDIASQSAGVAQDVERMNQSNWAGMLDAMGATSQEIARADVTSYGYRQGEDIAALQAAREDYLANVANQEFDLKFQEQQARLQAQQAAAANAARVQAAQIRAAQDAARQQADAVGGFLRNADPITRIITTGVQAGIVDNASAGRLTSAYESYFANLGNPPSGQMQWDANSAANAFVISPAAAGLNTTEKRLVQQAIRDSF